jgi:hypothetical protein
VATQTLKSPVPARRENPLLSYLSLFTSLGTLLCCALPSLLVLFGLGATVASFLSAFPWLVMLARHKVWVFAVSGVLIASDFIYVYWLSPQLKAHGDACSFEGDAAACDTASRISRVALWVAALIYGIGFFTAYLLGPILMRFGP